jgi:uncharacterized protein YukE
MIEKLAKTSQRWGPGRNHPLPATPIQSVPSRNLLQRQGVHKVDNDSIHARLDAMAQRIAEMQASTSAEVNLLDAPMNCELCGEEHYTAECQLEQVDFVSNNPYASNFNPGWSRHPNFSYRSEALNSGYPRRPQNPITGSSFQPRPNPNNQTRIPYHPAIAAPAHRPALPAPPPAFEPKPEQPRRPSETDELKKRLHEQEAATRNIQSTLQNLETQIGQLAKLLMDRPAGTLPANNEPNP